MSHREVLVPDDLTELDQWVLWRYEERNGRATKVPYLVGRPSARTHLHSPGLEEVRRALDVPPCRRCGGSPGIAK